MKTVAVIGHKKPTASRSMYVASALETGFKKLGLEVVRIGLNETQDIDVDLTAAYGWSQVIRDVAARQKALGRHHLHVDLGYWGRRSKLAASSGGLPALGYHKLALDCRHPRLSSNYSFPFERFYRTNSGMPIVKNWLPPAHRKFVVCGMSHKAAESYGYEPYEWERKTILELKSLGLTNKEIYYRPKPTDKSATPIEYSAFMDPRTNCWSLRTSWLGFISHHSNIAVDCLFRGTPFYQECGIVHHHGARSLRELVDFPYALDYGERKHLLYGVSYCQWTLEEIARGDFYDWLQLTNEGIRL